MATDSLEDRIKNVRLWFGIAAACFFIAFVYPLFDNGITSISDVEELSDIADIYYFVSDIKSMFLIHIVAVIGFIVSFYKLADLFDVNFSDLRAVAAWMIPYAVVSFMFYLLLCESKMILDLLRVYFETLKEFGIVLIFLLFVFAFFFIGTKLKSVFDSSAVKGLNIAGYGFYGMAVVMLLYLIAFYNMFSSSRSFFSDYDSFETLADLCRAITWLSVLAVTVGLAYAAIDKPKYLEDEDEMENEATLTAQQSMPSIPVVTPDMQSKVREMDTARLEEIVASSIVYDPGFVIAAKNELSVRDMAKRSDAELLKMVGQPQLYSYETLSAATSELYQRRVEAYINGFRSLTLEQLQTIASNPSGYYEADVRAATEELRRRYDSKA